MTLMTAGARGQSVRLLSAAAALLAAQTATAQVAAPIPVPDLTQPAYAPEQLSVGQRPHPDYDPIPIRLGSFWLLPTLDLGQRYDSNIYGSSVHDVSDFITFAKPSVALWSDWGGEDAMAFTGIGDVEQYARHTSENVGNVTLEADARLGVLSGEYFELRTGYQIQHESRYAPDSIAAVQYAGGGLFARYPTEYDVAQSMLSFVRSRGRLGLAIDAGWQGYTFSNVPTLNGGLAIQNDRSRNDYMVTPRLSYELAPGYQALLQASGLWSEYVSPVDATPEHLRRSSSGYAVAAGAQVDLGGPFTGKLYLGYRENSYADPRLGQVSGPYFSGDLLWNVTSLTSVTLEASRSIEETILIGSPGAWLTEVKAGVEHELLYSLLLTGDASFSNSHYQGIGRDDNLFSLDAGARWRLNPSMQLGLQGSWQRRNSTAPDNGFSDTQLSLDLKVAF